MTSIMANHIKRTKATTNHQCQTECHSLPTQIDVQSVVILPIAMALHVLLKIPFKACHKFGHFTSQCFQRRQHSQHKVRQPKAHEIHVNNLYDDPDSYPSDISSSEDSLHLQVRIQKQHNKKQQIPKLTHLITNIAYWLKQHHTRNQYLRKE